jgi:hypothetical protein
MFVWFTAARSNNTQLRFWGFLKQDGIFTVNFSLINAEVAEAKSSIPATPKSNTEQNSEESKSGLAVFLNFIREIPGSNLGRETTLAEFFHNFL